MKTTLALQNANRFANRLKKLRELHRQGKSMDRPRRQSMTPNERELTLKKTGGRCHICGGKIRRREIWQADHILAHAYGSEHSIENYLPAHSICNHYRWFYGTEEFQWILKLGVGRRTLIEKRDSLAMTLAEKFIKYELNRISRQRNHLDQTTD